MALNIKDPAVHAAVKRIAELADESQAEAVRVAVSERLARLERDSKAEEILAIGRRTAARLSPEVLAIDHGELLYNELGLPHDR